ncbi:MFS transporter [Lentzea kentuckyensis]|uniref:MFS transporter n=1 Tax=Lentzea kentuckyensis TaxID=360086 RepID=UPI000A39D0A5|nr:MFS transporter [Lentzea kentuckyensis]
MVIGVDGEGRGKAVVRLLSLAAGFALAMLDSAAVNVAGVTVMNGLGLGFTGLTWLLNGYLLAFAALLLCAGALAARIGQRRAYLGGLMIFVVGSAVAALAPVAGVLLVARVVQGVGAAVLLPSSLALLASSFPEPARRARAVALWTAVVSVATAAGPLIGGAVAELAGWRGVFLIPVPLGIAAMVATRAVIAPPPRRPAPIGWAGHVLAVVALTALCFALVEGPRRGWTNPLVAGAVVGAVLGCAGFLRWERTSARPVLPATLFADRRVSGAAVAGFLANCALFGRLYAVSVQLQAHAGHSPLWTGLWLVPVTGAVVLGNLLFARAAARFGTCPAMVAGFAVAGTASLALVPITANAPTWLLVALLTVGNLGVGLALPGLSTIFLDASGPGQAGVAAGALQAVRQVGALAGVAATGAVIVAVPGDAAAVVVFAGAGVCLLVAALMTAGRTRVPVALPV